MESLAERLERLEQAILNGENPEQQLTECLWEAEELEFHEHLAFEEAERSRMLLRKAKYLRVLLRMWHDKRRVRELEDKLQRMISLEAWEVFLDIEELLNTRPRPFALD